MKKLLLFSLTFVAMTYPVSAAIQRSADFANGHSTGIGLFGLSYDYGLGPVSLGLAVSSDTPYSFGSSNPRLVLGSRFLWRFMESEGLSTAFLAGLRYDPGYPGDRAYLTPDLGLSVAYDFREPLEWPWAIRLNLTVSSNQRTRYYSGDDNAALVGNFLQYLTIGPNTSLELAYIPNDNFEVTLGGGTAIGFRMKF